jgi:hypothetical protein
MHPMRGIIEGYAKSVGAFVAAGVVTAVVITLLLAAHNIVASLSP